MNHHHRRGGQRARHLAILSILSLAFGSAPATAVSRPHLPRPARTSIEYRLSWGVGATGADRVYRNGAAGEGVVVAMIDTGLDTGAGGLFGNVSAASVDLVPTRRLDRGDHGHGRQTASLLAGKLDGNGTFGIAYGATLLSIRADRDGSCERTCAFDPDVLAQGVDYAVAHGARVIGLPLASQRPIPAVEAALERAVASGVVIVAAAGNERSDQPSWPARYAADPRFKSAMIVAGASTAAGELAKWSNRAGVTADRYLAAPGERVIVDCADRYCNMTSGTSYSVAYVAGAVALLLSSEPTLSGGEAAEALLRGARAVVRTAPDANAGCGLLDVRRAARIAEQVAAERAGI